MKTKVLFAALLAAVGFVFTSCSEEVNKTYSLELSITPCNSSNAATFANYIREMYANKMGSNVSIGMEDMSSKGKYYANYNYTFSFDEKNEDDVNNGFLAVKNAKSEIVAKMKELDIWEAYAATGINDSWRYTHNATIGTWEGQTNDGKTITLKIDDEFSDPAAGDSTYTYRSNVAKLTIGDNDWLVNGKSLEVHYSVNGFGAYSLEDGSVNGTYYVQIVDGSNSISGDVYFTNKANTADEMKVNLVYNDVLTTGITLTRK